MYIKYFATNRDQENLCLDISRDERINLQRGGYNWIDTRHYMSYYLKTTDPFKMPHQALIHNSEEPIFKQFLNKPSIKRIIICIHGFNVHLQSAITSLSILVETLTKTTSLGSTLIIDQTTKEAQDKLENQNNLTAVIGFSWPSNGKLLNYDSDRREAVSSTNALANLIALMRLENPNAQIYVIAHSMGNFLTCTMLSQLVNQVFTPSPLYDYTSQHIETLIKPRTQRYGFPGKKGVFIDGYIMLAPDVERRHVTECEKDELEKIAYSGPFHAGLRDLVGKTYLFYSRHDQALRTSKVEKEVRELVGGVKEIVTGPDLNNRWEDSLGLNPVPNLAPDNMYSYNASTLCNYPIDHCDYFDMLPVAEKISEIIFNYQEAATK